MPHSWLYDVNYYRLLIGLWWNWHFVDFLKVLITFRLSHKFHDYGVWFYFILSRTILNEGGPYQNCKLLNFIQSRTVSLPHFSPFWETSIRFWEKNPNFSIKKLILISIKKLILSKPIFNEILSFCLICL